MDFPRLADFLAELAENNRREWFEAHRPEYQALRDDFTAFIGEVIERTADFDERVRWKELDQLDAQRRGAPGTEPIPLLDLPAAARALAHPPGSVRRTLDLRKPRGRIPSRWTGCADPLV